MKITKRQQETVQGEPSSEMARVKDEPISSDVVICLSGNSSSDDSSDDSGDDSMDSRDSTDSTNDDTDSSDSGDLKGVINDGKTHFSIRFPKKMSLKEYKRMYLVVRGLVRGNKISNNSAIINFHAKKRKKVTRKEKKKRHKNRKANFAKSTKKLNPTDKTEPRIELKSKIVEESLSQPNPPICVKPPTPQPENPNSAQPVQLSNFKDKIISSHCNNEVFSLGNIDTNRIKIATNNSNSFARYDDLNNGDLDYIEEPLNLKLPIAQELDPTNLLKDTEHVTSLGIQNTSQSPVQMIDNTRFVPDIKYEPELIINADEVMLESTKNVPSVPLIEKIKDESLELDSETANSGIADQMTDIALIDLEPILIKKEPIKKEPMACEDDVVILSDEEDDHKEPILENSCEKAIKTETFEDNSKKIVYHCRNLSKDAIVADSDDDDLKFHETLRNQLLKEISMLPEDEESMQNHVEKDSSNSPKKRSLEETFLSSDYSDYSAKKLSQEKNLRTKIAPTASDYETETTDEEAPSGDLLENQSYETNITTDCRTFFPENGKNSNRKETDAEPKSWKGIKPLNEKVSHDEKNSRCNKRPHDGAKAFHVETSSVKKRRSNEKFADKKNPYGENTLHEKSEVEKNCKQKSKDEISDRLSKSEKKIKTHKSDVKRHSSDAVAPRVLQNINHSLNENSNCAETTAGSQLMDYGNPVVLLKKFDDQIKIWSPSESVDPAKAKSDIKNITKSSHKQEAQALSTKSIDIQDNKRKIPTPEPKCSVSKSTTKVNRDFTRKSKSETKNDQLFNKSSTKVVTQTSSTNRVDSLDSKRKVSTLESKDSTSKTETKRVLDVNKSSTKQEPQTPPTKRLNCLSNKRKVSTAELKCPASQSTKKLNRNRTLKSETEIKGDAEKDLQQRKSADSVSADTMNANRSVQCEGETYNEVAMKILFEQSQKKVEEIKTFAINTGVTIVKLQMTMEARGDLVNEELEKNAKQSAQFKPTFSVDKHFGEHGNVTQCSEEKEREDKSMKLAKEIAVNEKIPPADYEKLANVKNELRKSLDPDSKESFTDRKVTPANNNFSVVKAERRESLVVTNDFVSKSGMNVATARNILAGKTNFPYDVERKPVTSFVGRIPKKTACQSNGSPIGIMPNFSENNSAHPSNEDSGTSEGKSPIENISLSKHRVNTTIQMVKETPQQTITQKKIPPSLPNFPLKIPRTLPQYVQHILHWEPSSFKENNGNVIRQLFGENYNGMRLTYESYEDFYRDAQCFLALKILDPLTCDPEKFHFTYSIVKDSICPKKILNSDVIMTTLKLNIVISRRDSLKKMYPFDGDLISFNYVSTDEVTKFVVENEVFAVIENVRSEIISDRTLFNTELRQFVPDAYELRTYTVMTKCIHDQKIHAKKLKKLTMIPKSHRNLLNFLALKNLLHSPLLNYIVHPMVEDYELPVVFKKYYPLVTKDYLDAQQLEAIARITETAIQREPKICLIQGPPGTGKTKVVVNIVRQLIHRSGKPDKNSPFRILVCAPSNSAVDEIAMRLLEERQKIAKDKKDERFRMVRVGCYDKINPKVKELSLEELTKKEFERFNDAAMKYDYEKIRKSIQFHSDQDYEFRIQKTGAKWYGARNHIARKLEDNKARWDFLKSRKFGTENLLDERERKTLYKAAESTVLEGAQVIVCTLASSNKNSMESVFGGTENGFSTCIIDESTKSSEVDTLLPLQLGVKTLILVGDTIQQPHSASIMPGETKLHDLDRSLFVRVRQAFAGQPENPIIQFQAQYRMAYPVAYWPQLYFYNGDLHNCANLRSLPVERYRVINLDFTQEDSEGVMNEHEGLFVVDLVKILMTRAGLDAFDQPVRIGVITPYHRQKGFIYNEMKHIMDRLPIELKQKIIVDVHTINGIQGQERDIIIMSCVTSNDPRLLSNKQELCMALTRAKHSMIVCGNFTAYWKDTMWDSLLHEAQSRHFYVDIPRYTHEDDIVAQIVR